MSILLDKEKKELIATCDCGCGSSIHISIDDEDDYYYAILSYMSSNWYNEQNGCGSVFMKKLKKIWAIIRNKDHHYAEVVMTKEDFKIFADYFLNHYTKLITKEINQETEN